MTPSDDSDIYSHVDTYSQENGESPVKSGDMKGGKLNQGEFLRMQYVLEVVGKAWFGIRCETKEVLQAMKVECSTLQVP